MFSWINQFDAILFDFDGLLIDTEALHFEAYKHALSNLGFQLNWDFKKYQESSCSSSPSLERDLSTLFPSIKTGWALFKRQKQELYLELLKTAHVHFMQGAQELLMHLQKKKKPHAIVTNSRFDEVQIIAKKLKEIGTVPHLIARESYHLAKPAPDPYIAALEKMDLGGKKVVAFEDTLRGITSIQQTEILPVLICDIHHPQLRVISELPCNHFTSLNCVDIR